MAEIRMFVYGTLMHKSHCRGWAEEAEVAPPQDAAAKGTLLDYGPFPYANFDGPGIIHGQILTMDADTVLFYHVCRVERGAGYVEREVVATTDDGTEVTCIGWQIGERMSRFCLPSIPSGDWNAHEAAKWGTEAAFT